MATSRLFSPLLIFRLTGCQSVAYYSQAVQGQISLLAKRKPIDRLLATDTLTPELRRQLESIQRIRQFASESLALPAKRQYASYVELGRP